MQSQSTTANEMVPDSSELPSSRNNTGAKRCPTPSLRQTLPASAEEEPEDRPLRAHALPEEEEEDARRRQDARPAGNQIEVRLFVIVGRVLCAFVTFAGLRIVRAALICSRQVGAVSWRLERCCEQSDRCIVSIFMLIFYAISCPNPHPRAHCCRSARRDDLGTHFRMRASTVLSIALLLGAVVETNNCAVLKRAFLWRVRPGTLIRRAGGGAALPAEHSGVRRASRRTRKIALGRAVC